MKQMKKTILVFMTVVSLSASAQRKDTVSKKPVDTIYLTLTMPAANWEALINLISTADEKPSQLTKWINYITGSLKKEKK